MQDSTEDLVFCVILTVIVVLGVTGNVTSFIVWSRGERCKKSTFAPFFKLLSLTETVLLAGPGVEQILLFSPLAINMACYSNVLCKLCYFTFGLLSQTSMWIIVSLTVSRTVLIYKPWLRLTRNHIYLNVAIIVSVFACLNLPFVMYDQVIDVSPRNISYSFIPFDENIAFDKHGDVISHQKCRKLNTDKLDGLTYIIVVQGCCFVAIPFLINLSCNCVMINQLMRRTENAQRLGDVRHKNANDDMRRFTVRVVLMSIVHCVTTVPFLALDIYILSHDFRVNTDLHMNGVAYRVAKLVFFFNSFINVFLYCSTGSDFRKDLKDILPMLKANFNKYTQ